MRKRATLVAVAAALLAGSLAGARAEDRVTSVGGTLVEVCTETGIDGVPELGPRTCKSFDSGAVLLALLCGQLPLPPDACATATDGRVIDPAFVDAFESSWVWRALRLQSRLDEAVPLQNSLWPHTHNSYNSTAYAPSVSSLDPNQRYSVADQLRLGIRGIELDIHWAFHPTGTAETGGRAVVLCHGESVAAGDLTIHAGCSVDRLLEDGLAEIRGFLDQPGNEREVVLLYLENILDGDPLAHELATAQIEEHLGDLVAKPPAGEPCAPMPTGSSRADLLADGHRVLIVGNCGPGSWGEWVHLRGPRWDEGSIGAGYPPFPACLAERAERHYDERFIRIWEDSTWLSAMVAGRGQSLSVAETAAMVRCGVDLIGFDRLEPGDGRLAALVWSWAPDQPVAGADLRCAAWGADARFRAAACSEVRRFACRTGDGGWLVAPDPGGWQDGFATCAGVGATFAVPSTGWDNEQLRTAGGGAGELWLNYQSIVTAGEWVPGAASPPA